MRFGLCLPLCSLSLSLWLGVANAQRPGTIRVSGTVADSSGRAIPYANVTPLPTGQRVVADADGRFALDVDTAVKAIELRRIGFEPRMVEAAALYDSALVITLTALPARLERVRVEAEQQARSLSLHGFYERQALLEKGINHGFMITPEEIEARKGARVTDFIYGHPAVKVMRINPSRMTGLRIGGTGGGRAGLQPSGVDGCRLEIYVDGIRFYTTKWPPDPQYDDTKNYEFIDDLISTSSVAAIEVYPTAVNAPPKYQPLNGNCGVILIWTK